MEITIYAFGKIKDQSFNNILNEYIKKINYYGKITINEIDEPNISDTKTLMNKCDELMLQKLDKIKKDSIVYLLDINGKKIESEFFGKILSSDNTHKNIVFLIGPSNGFSYEFREKYANKISFGNITMPYKLCRIILTEQIYRGFSIINNSKYHK